MPQTALRSGEGEWCACSYSGSNGRASGTMTLGSSHRRGPLVTPRASRAQLGAAELDIVCIMPKSAASQRKSDPRRREPLLRRFHLPYRPRGFLTSFSAACNFFFPAIDALPLSTAPPYARFPPDARLRGRVPDTLDRVSCEPLSIFCRDRWVNNTTRPTSVIGFALRLSLVGDALEREHHRRRAGSRSGSPAKCHWVV